MSIKSIASYNKTPCIIHLAINEDLNNKICIKRITQIIARFASLAITECNKKNISINCANLQQAKEVIHQIEAAASNSYLKITPLNNSSKTLL